MQFSHKMTLISTLPFLIFIFFWTLIVTHQPWTNNFICFCSYYTFLCHQTYSSHLVLPCPFFSDLIINQVSVTSTGVFADGPGAYLFHGVVDQEYVFHVMDFALCLSESKQKLCVKHVDRGGPNPKSMAGPSSLATPSLYVLLVAVLRLLIWHI